MKLTRQITAIAVLILLAGCKPTEQASTPSESATAITNRSMPESAKAAPVVPVDIAPTVVTKPPVPPAVPTAQPAPAVPIKGPAELKDEFVASMEQKLKDLDAKIDELAQKAAPYQEDAKAQAEKVLTQLREQRDKAKEKLEDLKKAGTEAWTNLKAGFESVMDELQKTYEDAKSKFS
jgi:hypothetical protein